ncbi:hypothetical protein GCM10011506_19870 [Marivirga lumbricoides]|uniref:DUF3037 domain-containing protein n=1 Tax=Marivirga lumbricoides TaxID=1046115 RepID=A0ABQ1M482_9BACT|nr:hypothetical protein GCM10011506_19870 [Marivirga lumbricoides]
MNDLFTYQILKYKSSIVAGEAVNVAVLFYFPEFTHFELVKGDLKRPKSIFPDFDSKLINHYLDIIEGRIEEKKLTFSKVPDEKSIQKYVHENILAIDAAGLVFDTPVKVTEGLSSIAETISAYSQLLLPGITHLKQTQVHHNEKFLITQYLNNITSQNKDIEKKLIRNKTITTDTVSLAFDIAWKNGTLNHVKPISFDLNKPKEIQNKASLYFGYIYQLAEYAKQNSFRFDFLVSRPQNKELLNDYENALDILNFDKTVPKRIITEDDLEKYSEETVNELN